MKLLLVLVAVPLLAQEVIPLRPGTASEQPEKIVERGTPERPDRSLSGVSQPSLTVYHPDPARSRHAAVIICPGGGYEHLAIDKEGHDIARWFQAAGYVGVVLKYRLPGGMKGTLEDLPEAALAAKMPIEDATEAVRIVRANAAKWQVNPALVGMMGFSAGGHLAAMMGISTDAATRPDFLMLLYPAIPHGLTEVPQTTPPTFLAHADDDRLSAGDNSVRFYLAMKKAKRPAELHVYSTGGHGFGMKKTAATSAAWPAALQLWLDQLMARK